MERVFVNVDRYGNTGAASVYVALEEALATGRIKKGDLILIAAFGGGFAWGTALIDRKSTRLNSSHITISYAVFCLKKKKKHIRHHIHLKPTHPDNRHQED